VKTYTPQTIPLFHAVSSANLLQMKIPKYNAYLYRTIILPVVSYGCETWSLTLREERKLRVFEKMVLR